MLRFNTTIVPNVRCFSNLSQRGDVKVNSEGRSKYAEEVIAKPMSGYQEQL